jgi:hypothetical protein
VPKNNARPFAAVPRMGSLTSVALKLRMYPTSCQHCSEVTGNDVISVPLIPFRITLKSSALLFERTRVEFASRGPRPPPPDRPWQIEHVLSNSNFPACRARGSLDNGLPGPLSCPLNLVAVRHMTNRRAKAHPSRVNGALRRTTTCFGDSVTPRIPSVCVFKAISGDP